MGNLLTDRRADLRDDGAVVDDDHLLGVVDERDLEGAVHLLELERGLQKWGKEMNDSLPFEEGERTLLVRP